MYQHIINDNIKGYKKKTSKVERRENENNESSILQLMYGEIETKLSKITILPFLCILNIIVCSCCSSVNPQMIALDMLEVPAPPYVQCMWPRLNSTR